MVLVYDDDHYDSKTCFNTVDLLYANSIITVGYSELLNDFCNMIYGSELNENEGKIYSKPMLWIGIYIAVASLFCILLMAADLFHGFRNTKLWFPSKYFTFNTASIMVITIAMKLPVDLSSPMPGSIDKLAKVGSMTFMCTMMANLLPSLASMDNRELFATVAGMVILVITLIVNILIQMETGILVGKYHEISGFNITMYIIIGAMLSFLVIVISSAITIPTSKRILEFKYQAVHKTTSNDFHSHHTRMSTVVEELTQHVRKYCVMARTCSPQFVMITNPLCSATGVICASTTILHYFRIVAHFITYHDGNIYKNHHSDYKWSMVVILAIQSIGIAVGSIAPIFRCFAALNFKLSIQWIKKHTKVCEVEKHWTQMLSEWKRIRISFPFRGHISKTIVYTLYNLILNLCIMCQKVIVVLCKIIELVPLGTVIIGVLCVRYWKKLKTKLFAMRVASNRETIPVMEQTSTNIDIGNYALRLQDEVELSVRTLKSISNSVQRTMLKAEKQRPINLLKLIDQFTGFEGVVNFDNNSIHSLIPVKFPNSWSLPVVTLTCIAMSLPNIDQESVDRLFNSGISYNLLVEENLNNMGEYVKIHKATTAFVA